MATDFSELLGQIGFAACFNEMPQQAVTIYESLARNNPNVAAVHVGLGVAKMNAYQLNEAIACFKYALVLEPDYGKAKGFLGMAYKLLGEQAAGNDILGSLAQEGTADTREFAETLLNSEQFRQRVA